MNLTDKLYSILFSFLQEVINEINPANKLHTLKYYNVRETKPCIFELEMDINGNKEKLSWLI